MGGLGKPWGVISLALLLFPAVGTAQTQMAALVLEASGESVPVMQPFSEIPANTMVSLAPGAKLVFLHYRTCRTVAITGGMISFSAEGYFQRGGTKQFDVQRPCPRTIRLKASAEMTGGVIRSDQQGAPPLQPIQPVVVLSTQPAFVLVGPRASDFASVRVSHAGQVVLEAPLEGRRFRWPTGAAPLVAEAEYELTLIPKTTGAAAPTLKFAASAQSSYEPGETNALISLD